MVDIDEDRIGDLLIEWDQRRRGGDKLSAAELCRDCPELIPEIADRIQSLKATDWLYREPVIEEPDGLSLPPLDWTLVRSAAPTLPEAVIPYEEFVRRVTGSGLVAAQTLSEMQAALGSDQGPNTRFLAQELVRRKKLTPYQSDVLCQGSSRPLVLGDYEILDRLGAGGMGEVFKARHRRMKRVVALKILPASVTDSSAALQRFQREVEVAAKLNHPNIVPAYDAREDQGTHYLITEFVEGQTLAALVKRQGPLPVHEAVRCLRQVAQGLAYAHQHGVVHRDIKPANLIRGQDGVVKIIDMGLARLEVPRGDEREDSTVGQLTGSQTVMGTVDYMAPEQATHTKTADARADIYSLGCTLSFLLTGRPLYDGQTSLERFLAHREQPIPALGAARDDVPAQLDAVFQKMVAKRPEDRFPTMAAVIAALDAVDVSDQPPALAAAPVLPAPETDASGLAETLTQRPAIGPSAPTRSWPQRRWIGLLGALAVLLVGGIWLGGIIFKVQTPGGTIVLECNQPELNGAVVSVDGQQKLTIKTAENAEPITIQVDKGRRQLEVVKGGFKTFTDQFEINAGQEKTVKVHLEPLDEATPLAAGSPAATSPQSEVADPVAVRRALEWLVENEGSAWVDAEGRTQLVRSASEIPTGPIGLNAVSLFGESPEARRPTDADLVTFCRLCQGNAFGGLTLISASLTGDGLASLRGMKVASLQMRSSSIPDEGLRYLPDISGLSRLEIDWTNNTDSGLRYIGKIRGLQWLLIRNGAMGDDGIGYLKPLKQLTEVVLQDTKISARGFEMLAADHPNLTGVTVQGVSMPLPRSLRHLGELPRLETIHLSFFDVGDAGVQQLKGVRALKHLYLWNCGITDASLRALAEMPGLESLTLGASIVSDVGLEQIAGLPNLKSLAISAAPVSDKGLVHVAKLGKLEALQLSETRVTDAGLAHLHTLSHLRTLDVTKTKVTAEGVQALKAALPNCQVTWDEPSTKDAHRLAAEFVVGLGGTVGVHPKEGDARYVSSAAELPEQPFELRNVSFYDGMSVTDAELATLARLCSGMTLDALRINSAPITDAGLAGLLSEIKLFPYAYLVLHNVPISDDGLKPLRGKSLGTLELPGTKITDEGLRSVAEVTDLGELNVNFTSIGDAGLGYLRPLAKLHTLHLLDTKVTDRGLACIGNNHPGLGYLGVSRTSVTDEGMEYVARLRNLNGLNLQDTQVGDDGLKHLAALVTLETLSLLGTKVSDEGMPHLANLAKLQGLGLGGTKVGNEGLRHLAGLSQMKSLDIGATPVSDEGLVHLGKLAALEELQLHETQVGDAGLQHLHGLSNLRILSVGTTKVTDAGVSALKAALPKCEVQR